MKKIKLAALAAFILFGGRVEAKVNITEIMYDLPGADAGREWVEIRNDGSGEISLSGWKFFDGSNHVLNEPPKNGGQGSLVLPSGGYAILAADAEVFLAEHSGFSGRVIDTAMSLSNTALTLKLIRDDGSEESSVSYSKEMGGAGDENSLQLNGSSWTALKPSPGSATSGSNVSAGNNEPEDTEENISSSSPESYAFPPPEFGNPLPEKISVEAGSPRILMAGAPALFGGKAYGLGGELLKNAYFFWNFGDGGTGEGENLMYTFEYPGDYQVNLEAYWGNFVATDSFKVKVVSVPITISGVQSGFNSYIKIKNSSSSDFDISLWHLRVGEKTWTFPKGMFILKNSEITLSVSKTGLILEKDQKVELLYPDARIAYTYSSPQVERVIAGTYSPAPKNTSYNPKPVVSNIGSQVAGAYDSKVAEDSYIPEVSFESELAAPVEAGQEARGSETFKWTLFLFGLIGSAVFLVFAFKKKPVELLESKKEKVPRASEFEILEDILD